MRAYTVDGGIAVDLDPQVAALVHRHVAALAAVEDGTPLLAATAPVVSEDPLAAWEAEELAAQVAVRASQVIVGHARAVVDLMDGSRWRLPADTAPRLVAVTSYMWGNGLATPVGDGQGDGEQPWPTTEPVRMLFAALGAMVSAALMGAR